VIFGFLLIILFFLVAQSPAFAADKVAVAIFVVGADNNPVPNALVIVEVTRSGDVPEATLVGWTDQNGVFVDGYERSGTIAMPSAITTKVVVNGKIYPKADGQRNTSIEEDVDFDSLIKTVVPANLTDYIQLILGAISKFSFPWGQIITSQSLVRWAMADVVTISEAGPYESKSYTSASASHKVTTTVSEVYH
jgi:hypothetical protein